MKKQISFVLVLVLLFTAAALPLNASASETFEESNKTSTLSVSYIHFDDGSYIERTVAESITQSFATMGTAKTKTGVSTYTYYDANGNADWKAALTASFTYNGTTSTCTSANCVVTIYDNAWHVISNSTTRSGNKATTELTMGLKVLGVTVGKPSYTLTISCDKNGNLS